MAKLNLSSPWVIFYREVEAFFRYDEEVHVVYDEDENNLMLYVEDENKAEALGRLLPLEKEYGAVTLKIKVIPANVPINFRRRRYNAPLKINEDTTAEDLFSVALSRNRNLSSIRTYSGIMSNPITYVVFVNRVVQYFNDSLSDIHGVCSTLYQEIAKDIFTEQKGVYYCTDFPKSIACGEGYTTVMEEGSF